MKATVACGGCGHGPMRSAGAAPDGELYCCPHCASWRLIPYIQRNESGPEDYGADYRDGFAAGKLDQLDALFREAAADLVPGRLLDIGCGNGAFLERRRSDGWEVAGLDCDSHAAALARERGIAVHVGLADGATLITPQCDVATLWDVLEHVPDPPATLSWLAGTVRRGGRLIVLTPLANGLLDRLARLERNVTARLSQRLMNLCLNRYHLQRFSRAGLHALLQTHGFTITHLHAVQVLSLKPTQYLSGFAPGIPGWTNWRSLDRLLSAGAYRVLRRLRIRNKLLCVAERSAAPWPTERRRNRHASQAEPPIVLMRPPTSRVRLYRQYMPLGSHEPALGLLYLASHLYAHGHAVSMIDGEQLGRRRALARAAALRPRLIGITASTFSLHDAASLARHLRALLPATRLVLGGPHASALPEDTLMRLPEIDACGVGEGEETLLELAEARPWRDVAGLVWRATNGAIHRNAERATVADLDRYPLFWHLLDGFPDAYGPPWQSRGRRRAFSLMASRGCPFACSFCGGPALLGRRRRTHTPERVVSTMRELHAVFGVREFYFHDDHFTGDRDWLGAFCRALIAVGHNWEWSCASRLETLNDTLLRIMRRTGCRQIGVGVESGSARVLESLNKHTSPDLLLAGLARVRAAGIGIKAYVMIGTPAETPDDCRATIRLLMRLAPEHVQVLYFTPLPGSPSWQHHAVDARHWPYMNLLNPMPCAALPRRALRRIEMEIYARTYGRRFTAWPMRRMAPAGATGAH